jgi:hypothetical protein
VSSRGDIYLPDFTNWNVRPVNASALAWAVQQLPPGGPSARLVLLEIASGAKSLIEGPSWRWESTPYSRMVLAARCRITNAELAAAVDYLREEAHVRVYETDTPGVENWSIGDYGWQYTSTGVPRSAYERVPASLRRAVLERDGHQCVRCGSTADLSIDHVYPQSLGGRSIPENLRTLCRPCNSSKGAQI